MPLLPLWTFVASYRMNSKMNSFVFKRYIVTLYFGRYVYLRRNFTFFCFTVGMSRSLSSVPFIVYIRPKSNCSVCMQLHFKAMWCNGRPKIWHNCCRGEEKVRSHFPQKSCLRLWASAVSSRYHFLHMWLYGHASWQTGPTSPNTDKDHHRRRLPPFLFLLH